MRVVILVLAFASGGCVNLSRQHHLTLEHERAAVTDSSCGRASFEIALFGTGNLASLETDDLALEFCATAYRSEIVAVGLVVPFLPRDGRAVSGRRWVRIENKSATDEAIIRDDFAASPADAGIISICTDRHPYDACPTLGELGARGVALGTDESVWVSLPERARYTATIHLGSSSHAITFIEATAYSWWMLTV